ncbi:hypothetical protein GF385_03475 [Candidatus Dependentiae bacterium]|nr:hypothetical protein [Candidatus Dependentiae bacterium]
MQLNITFFLQIFNFAITYWFLNKFMFKPVIKFIKDKQKKENNIKQSIEKKEQLLLKLEREKEKELQSFKFEMNDKYTVEPAKEAKVSSIIVAEVDNQEAKKLTEEAKEILVERVPNVD